MLDPNQLRKDLDSVVAALQKRKNPQPYLDVAAYSALEAERKTIQMRTEELQNKRNTLSKSIGMLKAKGESTDAVMAETGAIKAELETAAARNDAIASELQGILMMLPNLPHESVPVGGGEDGNVEVRRWGTPKTAGLGRRYGRQAIRRTLHFHARPNRSHASRARAVDA
jgi:seryl-tRNA synthetase